MVRLARRFVLVCAVLGFSTTAVAQFAVPKPEVFARPEDQQRARMIGRACTEADVGRGCIRFDGRLIREAPCIDRSEPGVVASKPFAQCYKLERSRRFRGIWVDQFEGQAFIPEGTKAPVWPTGDPRSPKWRKQIDRAIAASIWLDVESANVGHKMQQGGRRVLIEFVGRKTMYPGHYGHMGMSGHLIIVDRVISFRECPKVGGCRW